MDTKYEVFPQIRKTVEELLAVASRLGFEAEEEGAEVIRENGRQTFTATALATAAAVYCRRTGTSWEQIMASYKDIASAIEEKGY